ncbi:MAG: MaoC family dehydratase [Anaerolineales bacterium]|nr:MaoC family dehydratase [Anaerolineales bacterium]
MPTLNIGQKATRTQTITDEMIRTFAALTGDSNPVHLDDAFAATTRFGRRIAHGMLAASLISAALANDLPGPGTVYLSQSIQFKAPVFPGDTITAIIEVKSIRNDKPIAILTTICVNQENVTIIEGEAAVLMSS